VLEVLSLDLVVVFELEGLGCLGTCNFVNLVRQGTSDCFGLQNFHLIGCLGPQMIFDHLFPNFKVVWPYS